jgi:mediator of RNA polymerase II transcription subunit 7
MADQDQNSLASTFPDPPPFWKDFTPDRLAKIAELRAAYAEKLDGDDEVPARIPNVPHDLMLLQPPAEPTDGRWRIFGDQYMVRASYLKLKEVGTID